MFLGFNPRTRMGCDLAYSFNLLVITVSIHAPAWGATPDLRELQNDVRVSIHAPAWGATYQASCQDVQH